MRATCFLVLASLGVVLTCGALALGYQTQFPSATGTTTTIPPATYGSATPAPAPNTTVTPPYKAPSYNTPSYNTPSYNTPSYDTTTIPPASPVTPGQVPGPTPTYGTQVQPPPVGWDPYAPPGSAQPTTILPQDYYPLPAMPETAKLQRLIDEIRVDYHLLAPRGSKKFGTNDLELSTTFAFPFFYNERTPLLITPGFAFHWWQGPSGKDVPPQPPYILPYSLPPRVYDAYLGAAWNPQITPQVGGELEFRIGVYSDFEKVSSESLRYTGRGLFVLSLSDSFKAKLGIVYYDRVRIKMLPAGGLVWKPNEDTEFSLIFPYPRISRRLSNYGVTEWWVYCRGDYGGGSWTMSPDKTSLPLDQMDYNDLRFALGLEFDRMDRIGGLLEVGCAFDRELVVRSTGAKYSPSTTIFLRAGLVR